MFHNMCSQDMWSNILRMPGRWITIIWKLGACTCRDEGTLSEMKVSEREHFNKQTSLGCGCV